MADGGRIEYFFEAVWDIVLVSKGIVLSGGDIACRALHIVLPLVSSTWFTHAF